MQHFDAIDIITIETFSVLLIASLACWAYEAWRTRRRRIPRMFAHPHQDAIDALQLQRYRAAISRSAKAQRAARALEKWHADPRSEGRSAQVIPLKRRVQR